MTTSLPECPIATAAVLMGDKWKVQIMRELLLDPEHPKHFSDFQRTIIGISDKMLSKSLKDLEADHIIEREILDSKPPRNVYMLSDMGAKLGDILLAMSEWGQLYQKTYGRTPEEKGTTK